MSLDTPGTITGHTRSILIQVGFKAAIELATSGKIEPTQIEATTESMYKKLIGLHEKYEAGDVPNSRGGGGGFRKGGGGGGGPKAKVPNEAKDVVMIDYFGNGNPIAFYDQRPFKKGAENPSKMYADAYSERAADFQSVDKHNVDGEEKNIPIWLTSPNGEPNEDARAMVAKAFSGQKVGASVDPDEAPF